MADKIKLKAGEGATPKLENREPAYNKTEKSLYIGTESGNEKVGDAGWEQRIKTCESQITATNARIDELNVSIAEIIARLDALTTPSE